jgi:hypothetical protein
MLTLPAKVRPHANVSWQMQRERPNQRSAMLRSSNPAGNQDKGNKELNAELNAWADELIDMADRALACRPSRPRRPQAKRRKAARRV